MNLAEDSILRAVSPSLRAAMLQQLQFVQMMQDRPVILAMPVSLIVK